MGKALEGIRVLDFTTMAAGPTAAAMLADYGAEVIKIERPGRGEDGRKFPPMVDGESLTYCWFNRGKKSLAVDMKDPDCTGDLREFPSRNHEEIWSGL